MLDEAGMFRGAGELSFELLNAIEQDDGFWGVLKQRSAPIEGFPLDAVELRLVYFRPDTAQFQRRREALGIMLGGAIAEDGETQLGIALIGVDRPSLLE